MVFFWHPTVDRISCLLDGMLEPRSEWSLREHLSSCARCQSKAQAFAQVKSALQALPALEEQVVGQPTMPVPMPLIRNTVSSFRMILGGLGAVFFVGSLVLLQRPQPALKVISSNLNVFSSEGILGEKIVSDSSLRTLLAGNVDLEIPDQVLLRLKPGTTITWQQTGNGWFAHRPQIVVNLMRGELLARTKDSFWGSQLEIRTPTATTAVKGTAFAVKVNPSQDETTLKVLAGNVFFSPYLKQVGVHVQAGQESRIRGDKLPDQPKELLPPEKQMLLETYRIGQEPPVALVIGGGPERTEELLDSAILYVTEKNSPEIQPLLRKTIKKLNAALLEGEPEKAQGDMKILELAVEYIAEPDIVIPLKLFVGAYEARLGEVTKAQGHFQKIVEQFPNHSLTPVALGALGVTTQRSLHDLPAAEKLFQRLIARYPKSPEAVFARQMLKR